MTSTLGFEPGPDCRWEVSALNTARATLAPLIVIHLFGFYCYRSYLFSLWMKPRGG